VSVAGLSMASIQAMPGFPVNAYREGHRAAGSCSATWSTPTARSATSKC
jgi:hypothetical protein